MFKPKKNKRFNYQSRFSKKENSEGETFKKNLAQELKRQPKQSNTKVSTLIFLIGLLIVVIIAMYILEFKIK
jgi:anaerobic C4-dicarboxylate transporter